MKIDQKERTGSQIIAWFLLLAIVVLLVLISSSSAGEIVDTVNLCDGDRFPDDCPHFVTTTGCIHICRRSPDTTRYYAKVDTCLTCPEGFDGPVDIISYGTLGLDSLMSLDKYCRHACRQDLDCYPDTIINNTWLPKIQVWLTPDEIKKLGK